MRGNKQVSGSRGQDTLSGLIFEATQDLIAEAQDGSLHVDISLQGPNVGRYRLGTVQAAVMIDGRKYNTVVEGPVCELPRPEEEEEEEVPSTCPKKGDCDHEAANRCYQRAYGSSCVTAPSRCNKKRRLKRRAKCAQKFGCWDKEAENKLGRRQRALTPNGLRCEPTKPPAKPEGCPRASDKGTPPNCRPVCDTECKNGGECKDRTCVCTKSGLELIVL